jgi:protein SCO1/2
MTIVRRLRRIAVALIAATAVAAADEPAHVHVHAAEPPAALPGGSLYQLGAALDTVGGERIALDSLRGAPVVVTMFYSTCTSVCPMLTQQMQRVAAALDAGQRARVRFLMVSFDAARDTPARLADFAAEHHLPRPPFVVAHAAAGDVRAIAAALGIRYRQLPDGSFSHSSLLTLLDRDGVPVARSTLLAGDDPEFVARVRALGE